MPATQPNELALILYAPALVGADGRPLAVVRGMERVLPGLRLRWPVSDTGQCIPLPERDEWISQEWPDRGFPILCNGDENGWVSVTGWEMPIGSSSGAQPQLEVHVVLPLAVASVAVAMDCLENAGESARAFWGHATPFLAGVEIARQTKNWAANPRPPPRGLPALKLPREIRSPEVPHRLGWLNYWSAAAARAIGFPDPARDAEWLSRARRTATGGWVVRLTDEPLDLEHPSHLDALLRAHERFPEMGGRSLP